jgi:hypothetical protein
VKVTAGGGVVIDSVHVNLFPATGLSARRSVPIVLCRGVLKRSLDITGEGAQARARSDEKALGHISLSAINFRVSAV